MRLQRRAPSAERISGCEARSGIGMLCPAAIEVSPQNSVWRSRPSCAKYVRSGNCRRMAAFSLEASPELASRSAVDRAIRGLSGSDRPAVWSIRKPGPRRKVEGQPMTSTPWKPSSLR
ncbi:hypothetical protein SFUMM280S_00504 [Streptomyces fumanus]